MNHLSALLMSILISYLPIVNLEIFLGGETDDFDFDGFPGAMHQLRWDLGAGVVDCFFQNAAKGANLYVTFKVLRGGDRNVDVIITDPNSNVVARHLWKSEGSTEYTVTVEGIYQICIDNTFSRFTSKLVYLYLVTFIAEQWDKYAAEVQEISFAMENFTTSLTSVQASLASMVKFQVTARMEIVRDWYLITGNLNYVGYWSTAQCFVIIASAVAQVYFLRRLFDIRQVTPTSKPRA